MINGVNVTERQGGTKCSKIIIIINNVDSVYFSLFIKINHDKFIIVNSIMDDPT